MVSFYSVWYYFSKQYNMPTFVFPGIEIGTLKDVSRYESDVSTIMKGVDVYKKNKHVILQTSKPSSETTKSIRCGSNNGLVSGSLTAYDQHVPLVYDPNEIWLAIMVAFGKYVDGNPKQMKKYFVSDEEKAEIEKKEAEKKEQKRLKLERRKTIQKKIDERMIVLKTAFLKENPDSKYNPNCRQNDAELSSLYGKLLDVDFVKCTEKYDEYGYPIHEGPTRTEKKKLNVTVMEYELPTTQSSPTDIYNFVSKFTDEIEKNSNESIVNWILPAFSTTTEEDRMVGKLVLMGTVKKFFSYGCGAVSCCGISKVTLEGTLEDWIQLRQKVNRLCEFDAQQLVNWGKVLGHVLDNFIELYKGTPDLDFWQQMYTEVTGGSGMKYQRVSGWILAFAPFDDKGRNILNSYDNIMKTRRYGCISSHEICNCGIDATINVTVTDALTKKIIGKFNYLFYSGLLVAKYDTEKNEMRASVDWCMIKEDTESASSQYSYDE